MELTDPHKYSNKVPLGLYMDAWVRAYILAFQNSCL